MSITNSTLNLSPKPYINNFTILDGLDTSPSFSMRATNVFCESLVQLTQSDLISGKMKKGISLVLGIACKHFTDPYLQLSNAYSPSYSLITDRHIATCEGGVKMFVVNALKWAAHKLTGRQIASYNIHYIPNQQTIIRDLQSKFQKVPTDYSRAGAGLHKRDARRNEKNLLNNQASKTELDGSLEQAQNQLGQFEDKHKFYKKLDQAISYAGIAAQIGTIVHNLRHTDNALYLERQKNTQIISAELEKYCQENQIVIYKKIRDPHRRLENVLVTLERDKRIFLSLHLAYAMLGYINDHILLESQANKNVFLTQNDGLSTEVRFLSKLLSTQIYSNKGWHFPTDTRKKFEIALDTVDSSLKIRMTTWINYSIKKTRAFLQAELLLNNDSITKSYQIINLLNQLDQESLHLENFIEKINFLHQRTLQSPLLNDGDRKIFLSAIDDLPKHFFAISGLLRRILEGAVEMKNYDTKSPPADLADFL